MNEMRNCPGCGGNVILTQGLFRAYIIECQWCGTTVRLPHKKAATIAWNHMRGENSENDMARLKKWLESGIEYFELLGKDKKGKAGRDERVIAYRNVIMKINDYIKK